ncbi:ATP-dependent metallopeptidase FtsH/Yme1/Tma family protein [Clostridium peptidivorans]|uniref:ATP-dependent metallopeptidase FtsH/Yme1/Tma family protein n=1 Tax=Clostridium peptidivorans TaxID=100174 RepID=UPI000BE4689A|nr:FtsH/Yme1/Tma family ATP-dependent metallopeptidase [Clostridium peptidivorans]
MNRMKKKTFLLPLITAALSLVLLIASQIAFKTTENKSYVNFLKDLNSHKISKVYLSPDPQLKVVLNDGTSYETDNPRIDTFKEVLLKEGVKVLEYSEAERSSVIFGSAFLVSIISLVFVMAKNSNLSNKGLLGVDKLETSALEDTSFTFENVAGNEEAKESVKDVVDFLKNPEKYAAYGARMPKGVILYGDPGTGKTLLAKAVAGEAGVPFYAMSGSDFVQVYVGVGASRVRQLFKKARQNGKAVIFIDEIDAIGKKRDGGKAGGSDEKDQTLNALLTEMSGFNEKEGIIIMAATNRLDILDEALLRPGRFDRHIEIMLPDISAREKILNLHLKNKPVGDITVHEWAQKTSGFSGAKIESLVNEAAILACKDEAKSIENLHMDKAFSIVIAGHEKQDRDYITEKDRKVTAYHETGHALVGLKMLPNEKVSKITIIPSTKGAGGYTMTIPEDKLYQDKSYLKRRIMMLLGGRAAEEIIFGEDNITTGASHDLKQCTNIAYHMLGAYGMGKSLGLLSMEVLGQDNPKQADLINECKELIDSLYEETKALLLREKDLLEAITQELLEKETIHNEKLMEIVNKQELEPIA